MAQRYLGLDVGRVRVGVAISDPENRFALPLEIADSDTALDRIAEIVAHHEIGKVIVGLPISLRGDEGSQAKKIRRFGRELAARIAPVPVDYHDERMTSLEAEKRMHPDDRSARRDAVAAAIMLESWLRRPPNR